MKRWVVTCFIVALVLSVGFAVYSLFFKKRAQLKSFPPEPPIAFQPSNRMREPCRAVYYGFGNGDGVYDPVCFDLQAKLSEAADQGDIERIKELLRAGANANAKAGSYISPLQTAASRGHIDAARLLLDNGADVNCHYHPIRGMPLSSAVFRGQAEMVRFLLSRGADTSLEIEGRTVLAWAKQQKSWEIVEILEEAGAKE
jgi:hypothetical protein